MAALMPKRKRPPTAAEMGSLACDPAQLRSVCVLGHVDHGKSSLVDWLLAENGIVPARLAGTLRYLDDTPDEQERGITMRASAINIRFCRRAAERPFLVTLVDSPGHVDFSHDASAAARLADGALIVVDVVEGVRVQTRAALRAACAERLVPVLVLNKIDRLVGETADTPEEAFGRLRRVLEAANAALFEALELHACEPAFKNRVAFDFGKNNVVLASALDGWGVGGLALARRLAGRVKNAAPKALAAVLLGDVALRSDGTIVKLKEPCSGDALFPTLFLTPLFALLAAETAEEVAAALADPLFGGAAAAADAKKPLAASESIGISLRTPPSRPNRTRFP